MPAGVVFVEPVRRRVRGLVGGETVIDTEAALLVHRAGHPPAYAFPSDVVPASLPTAPEVEAPDHVQVPWGAADAWFEEDQHVLLHPRNPYHRVECLPTSRTLRVVVDGQLLADGPAEIALYETALEPKLYVSPDLVADGVLEPSETVTHCPSKGDASWWSAQLGDRLVADVAWSYEDPFSECLAIAGLLCFDDAVAQVEHDLPPAP
jgi:uncharacterized protein (DUF427 family)